MTAWKTSPWRSCDEFGLPVEARGLRRRRAGDRGARGDHQPAVGRWMKSSWLQTLRRRKRPASSTTSTRSPMPCPHLGRRRHPHADPGDERSPGAPLPSSRPGTGLGEAFLTWDGDALPLAPLGRRPCQLCAGRRPAGRPAHVPDGQAGPRQLRACLLGHRHPEHLRVPAGERARATSRRGCAEQLDARSRPDAGHRQRRARRSTGGCDLCELTLDVFVSILGSEAGNLALKVLATGGVFVGGGIPPRILPRLDQPAAVLHDGVPRQGPLHRRACRRCPFTSSCTRGRRWSARPYAGSQRFWPSTNERERLSAGWAAAHVASRCRSPRRSPGCRRESPQGSAACS